MDKEEQFELSAKLWDAHVEGVHFYSFDGKDAGEVVESGGIIIVRGDPESAQELLAFFRNATCEILQRDPDIREEIHREFKY